MPKVGDRTCDIESPSLTCPGEMSIFSSRSAIVR